MEMSGIDWPDPLRVRATRTAAYYADSWRRLTRTSLRKRRAREIKQTALGNRAAEDCSVPEDLFDSQQLVILADTVRSAG